MQFMKIIRNLLTLSWPNDSHQHQGYYQLSSNLKVSQHSYIVSCATFPGAPSYDGVRTWVESSHTRGNHALPTTMLDTFAQLILLDTKVNGVGHNNSITKSVLDPSYLFQVHGLLPSYMTLYGVRDHIKSSQCYFRRFVGQTGFQQEYSHYRLPSNRQGL